MPFGGDKIHGDDFSSGDDVDSTKDIDMRFNKQGHSWLSGESPRLRRLASKT